MASSLRRPPKWSGFVLVVGTFMAYLSDGWPAVELYLYVILMAFVVLPAFYSMVVTRYYSDWAMRIPLMIISIAAAIWVQAWLFPQFN